jgi:spore coat polysaccharide biosynthesis protein SpsF (cytidylyltransferase family)
LKAALLVSARSGSKRLPQKHFAKLNDKYSALDILCTRLNNMLSTENISVCVVTTTNEEDRIFDKAVPSKTEVFHGSVDNIPYRQYQAAKSLNADLVVAIDGDDTLTCPEAISLLMRKYNETQDASEKLFYTVGLPFGMNVSCYSTELLGKLIEGKETQKLETGWGRIFPQENRVEVPCHIADFPEKEVRFTLDYEEDLKFFTKVVGYFQDKIFTTSTASIIDYVVKNEIYKCNESVVAKYWENFHIEKGLEENASK